MATEDVDADREAALLDRVRELETTVEQLGSRVEEVETDEHGRTWSVSGLMSFGLTRRQALYALSALAGGAGIAKAISTGVATVQAEENGPTGPQIGTADRRVDLFAGDVDAESVDVEDSFSEPRTDEIRVPSDFPTLSEAFDHVSMRRVPPSVGYDIIIESGHEIQTSLSFSDADYSHIRITAEDSIVPFDASYSEGNFIHGNRSTFPRLDALFDMGGNSGDGILVGDNSRAWILEGGGVVNAGDRGLSAQNSAVRATNTDFSAAGNECLRAATASRLMIQNADFSDGGNKSAHISRACIVAAADADFSGSTTDIRRSLFHGGGGTFADIDVIHASSVSLAGSTFEYLRARRGASVDIVSSTINANNDGIRAVSNASVNANRCTINDPDRYAVFSEQGSNVNLFEAEFNNVGSRAIALASGANIINAFDATVDGSPVTTSDINISDYNTVESAGIVFN